MASGDRGPSSMFEVLRDLEDEGYAEDMVVRAGGRVVCRTCDVESPAAEFAATGLHRLEGSSDPADTSAVVGVTCPRCRTKGVLVLRDGPGASAEDAAVLAALDPA